MVVLQKVNIVFDSNILYSEINVNKNLNRMCFLGEQYYLWYDIFYECDYWEEGEKYFFSL